MFALLLAAAAATGTPVTACRILKAPNETYVLENDVSSPGTCFSIQGNNITLDLNGHTITYGTTANEKKIPSFAILAADCWYVPIEGNPCGGSHLNPVIENGKIVQGQGAAPFSHAIRIGQGNNQDHLVAHNLDITVNAPDSIGIYGEYLSGGSNIYRNTIHNNVTVITSRSQFRGASIKMEGEQKARIPNHIHDNIIIGGAQLGIRDVNPSGSLIYNNDVSQDATYTNGFCIDAAGPNMQIYHNNCHPTHGRGIHANQAGASIHDNKVDTVDSDKNEEYGGCEINGTYGIQVESDGNRPSGIKIYNNDVTVHAAGCSAEAMRLTDLTQSEDLDIHDNTFRALADITPAGRSTKGARALSLGNTFGDHILFDRNHLIADDAMVYYDWDSGGRIVYRNCDFNKGPHPSPDLLLISLDNGAAPSQGTVFVDSTFNGVSPKAAHFGDYAGASSYEVAHTRHFTLQDGAGKPVAGLQFSAHSAQKGQLAQGTADHDGKVAVIVPVYVVSNAKGKPQVSENASVEIQFDKNACPAKTLRSDQTASSQAPEPIVCK